MKPELKGAFLSESRDLLERLRKGLRDGPELERRLSELYRCAHTLKGSARFAGLGKLELVTGRLAAQLKAAKERGGVDGERLALWREAVEAAQALVEEGPVPGFSALMGRLSHAAAPPAGAPPAELKILLIEDSDLQAQIIRKDLAEARGGAFSLERADRLEVGLERAAQGGIDAALLDLDLPDSQGVETLDRLAARVQGMPVVILTASDDEAMAMEALRRGAQDYVVKGRADAELLSRSIRYAIERKRVEWALRRAREELELRVRERTAELARANETLKTEVAERGRAQEELRRKSEELERSNIELGQFASVASHELQAPLGKIIGFGDLLERISAPALDAQGREFLRRMKEAAERESRLIRSLGELSLVTRTARPLERIELGELVGDVLDDLGAMLVHIGGRAEVGALPAVMGDPVQLRQVFHNLFGNAVKFRKKDQPLVIAVKSREAEPETVEVSVEDNGIGFKQEYAERILEPYQRLHAGEEFEGIGMGLAICEKILRRHGGRISARSEPGKGSVFTLTLPRLK